MGWTWTWKAEDRGIQPLTLSSSPFIATQPKWLARWMSLVELLGNAAVTLFPISWREPFGLVMVESMATVTPVIGIGLGSVPEVIVHSKTGFVCQMVEEMASFIPAALELNRQDCRNYAVSCFSVEQIVDGYEAAYLHILATI